MKDGCHLNGLWTKKLAMTKVKARQNVNFMSNLIQYNLWPIVHGMVHMAANSMWSRDLVAWHTFNMNTYYDLTLKFLLYTLFSYISVTYVIIALLFVNYYSIVFIYFYYFLLYLTYSQYVLPIIFYCLLSTNVVIWNKLALNISIGSVHIDSDEDIWLVWLIINKPIILGHFY